VSLAGGKTDRLGKPHRWCLDLNVEGHPTAFVLGVTDRRDCRRNHSFVLQLTVTDCDESRETEVFHNYDDHSKCRSYDNITTCKYT
jgi:hypothetical protein